MVRIRASVLALVATLAVTVGVAPASAKAGKHGKGDAASASFATGFRRCSRVLPGT